MTILALIPARAGSKRLPGKNKRALGGKPLIRWSLDAVDGVEGIGDVLVSTDDLDIIEIARNAGALAPWLRPPALASDSATTVDVALHALEWYVEKGKPVEGLLLLQPTSPFRTRETILRGLRLFAEGTPDAVVSVSAAHPHPAWCLKIEGGFLKPYGDGGGLKLRSQDLPDAYAIDGAFYLISPDALLRSRSFVPEKTLPLVIQNPKESLDIDTEFDWQMAVAMCGPEFDNE